MKRSQFSEELFVLLLLLITVLRYNMSHYPLPNYMKKTTKKDQHPSEFKVKRSSAGLGLFATIPFEKEDFVIQYIGEKISHDEADRRGGKYLFTLNEKWVVDGKERSNTARYINHSCKPNMEAVIEDDKRIIFMALRNIKPGEELSFDYGKEYVEDIIAKAGCKCEPCLSQ